MTLDRTASATNQNSAGELIKQLSSARISLSEHWDIAFAHSPRFKSSNPGELTGFAGYWFHFKGCEAYNNAVHTFQRALRCYSFSEDNSEIIYRHFHEEEPGADLPSTRRQDGLYETSVRKRLDNPYFSCSMKPTPAELQKGGHACFCWRCLSIEDAFLIRMTASLPPGHVAAKCNLPHPGLNDSLLLTQQTWGLEAILDDGICRWSMGPLYSTSTLQLVSNLYTREHYIRLKTAESLDMNGMPYPDPRSRLHEDPQEWLPDSHQSGFIQELIWDEDGQMIRLEERPSIWHPPKASDPTSRLIRYEDAVYAHYPAALPSATEQQQLATSSNLVRIEFGGRMRHVNEFRRVVLRFKVGGPLESLSYEWHAQFLNSSSGARLSCRPGGHTSPAQSPAFEPLSSSLNTRAEQQRHTPSSLPGSELTVVLAHSGFHKDARHQRPRGSHRNDLAAFSRFQIASALSLTFAFPDPRWISQEVQLLRMKPPLDSMALPISDAAKILDGLAVLLEQASDSLATESAEVLRAIIKTYPELAPEVGDADVVSALTIALKHGCEFLISDLQAAVVPALEASLGLLSAKDSGSFTAAATLAAPSIVSLFAPQQQLVAIPSLAPDTAKAAVRALCILAKDEDPEIQDILLAVEAIPVLTRLTASMVSDVKQLAAAALAALAEISSSQAMQQAIREAGDVFAATNRLTATATSSQLADLLVFLTNDVSSQANAQATTMVIGAYTDVRKLFMPPVNESGQSNLGKRLERMYSDCLASDDDTFIRRQSGFAGSVVDQLSAMRHQAQERALRLLADVTLEEQQCERIVMVAGIIPKLVAFLQKPENPTAATSPARMVAAYLGQLAARSLRLRSTILDAGATKTFAGLITRKQPKLAEIAALALAALQSRASESELADSAHEEDYADATVQQEAGEKPAQKRGLFRRAPKEKASPSKKDTKQPKQTREDMASGEMPSAEFLAMLNAQPSLYIPALVRLLASRLPGVVELAAASLAAYDISSGKGSSKLLTIMKEAQAASALMALIPLERLGQLDMVESQQEALAAEAAGTASKAQKPSRLSFPIIRGRSKSRDLKTQTEAAPVGHVSPISDGSG
ncbi:hypothetical protein WJX74_010622 [Apatococcus lobatus]|uniref:Uncharacterized protein n=1 Tax=Apatococcus lobatus TaxID=904363 RepID=A0AAW1QAY6_9CHLO